MRGRRGGFPIRPKPSCAARPFLQPCDPHDSGSAVVDDADARHKARVQLREPRPIDALGSRESTASRTKNAQRLGALRGAKGRPI